MKSRSTRSPGCTRIEPSAAVTVCRLERTSPSGRPAGSMATSMDSATGLGNPGNSTGGVMRDASGVLSVSGA